MKPIDRLHHDEDLSPATPAGPVDWGLNYKNIVPKTDRLLDHGIYALHQNDPRARPFMLLRAQVLNALSQMKAQVIAVTSPSASNGKSHVAANLACAISRARETVLMDLHLRRPVISDRFGLPEVAGIGSYLQRGGPIDDLSFRIQDERLTIHPAGYAAENSADLLLSTQLGKLFSHATAGPDEPICVIDTPPVLESDDMLMIAKQVDGVLFVIEDGRTTKDEVLESMRLLNGTPVLGTLLNKTVAPLPGLKL